MEELRATILGTVYRNDENGYSVLEARAGRENATVVGSFPELAPGETAIFDGEWTTHPQYGRQFKAAACRIEQPTTLRGIEKYLSSGLIKGVGPATAGLIVSAFGKDALDIMSEKPERLCEVPGIGRKRAQQIAQSFQAQHAARKTMVYLQTYGVSPALAARIAQRYGDRAEEIVRENPYRLADDIEGVGFRTADRIALSMGLPADSDARLRAGIKYTLENVSASAGHTYLPREDLIRESASILNVDEGMIGNLVQGLSLTKELISFFAEDGAEAVCLPSFYRAESEIASRLKHMQDSAQTVMEDALEARVSAFERANDVTFSDEQKRACLLAVNTGLLVITGGPGTGKTTIINCILYLLRGGLKTLLAAPTGRAAKRMSEATGREAATIHRLLEFSGEEGMFQKDENDPLDCDCMIVDEMSMMDVFLMRSLLRALREGTRLLLVGDADQLPSVGAGNVLGDILRSGVVPSVRLTQIFRQGGESMIVENAHRINHGEMPYLNQRGGDFFFERQESVLSAASAIVALCARRLPSYLKTEDSLRAIQVLSPTKKGDCGVYNLNKLLQQALNPLRPGGMEIECGQNVFRVGDKVMHIHNDYQLEWTLRDGTEGKGVFNGDVGFVTDVDLSDRVVTVLYDDERIVLYSGEALKELELAYCLSVHKSQGSEFGAVVMPVVGGPPMLLTRNLFYTALTRARRLVVLVGREECVYAMVRNNHIARRYTTLCQRLLTAL